MGVWPPGWKPLWHIKALHSEWYSEFWAWEGAEFDVSALCCYFFRCEMTLWIQYYSPILLLQYGHRCKADCWICVVSSVKWRHILALKYPDVLMQAQPVNVSYKVFSAVHSLLSLEKSLHRELQWENVPVWHVEEEEDFELFHINILLHFTMV